MSGVISEGAERLRVFLDGTGKLVVAGYFQPPTQQSDGTQVQRAGHIDVVRPQEAFPSDEGPQVVTAGVQNFKSASMKFAFGDRPLDGRTTSSSLSTIRLSNKG
jgi:hypothetical protein